MTENDAPSGQPEQPFDPYRYGKPDHPIPPEYAPPGYVPDPPAQAYPPHPYYGPSPYASIPPPYGAPPNPYGPPPSPYGYPPRVQGASGMAIASLVLGLVSLIGALFAFLDAVPVVLAVVFGIIVLTSGRPGRGMAITGIICGAVGGALAIAMTVWLSSAVNKCGGWDNTNDPDFSHCLQQHL